MTQAALGLDVGGQFVKAALVSGTGQVLAEGKAATGEETTIDSLAASFASLRETLAKQVGVHAASIGVGVAGVIGRDGVLRGSPHLPQLVGRCIAGDVSARIGAPVVVHNDADCAAMAEGWDGGAAAGRDDFLLVAIGTGIGSGLVLGGRLRAGSSNFGCEFGHMTLVQGGRRCGCGNLGCVEAYVSESAAVALVEEAGNELRASVASRRRQHGGGAAQALFGLADDGDGESERLAAAMVDALGAAIGSVVNVLDLTTIVIGGGIAPGVLARMERLSGAAASTLFARPACDLELVAASRGPLAGAIGAARLALERPARIS